MFRTSLTYFSWWRDDIFNSDFVRRINDVCVYRVVEEVLVKCIPCSTCTHVNQTINPLLLPSVCLYSTVTPTRCWLRCLIYRKSPRFQLFITLSKLIAELRCIYRHHSRKYVYIYYLYTFIIYNSDNYTMNILLRNIKITLLICISPKQTPNK